MTHYYSAYKTKMLPHQPLNGSLKYWSFFFILFCLWGKNVATSAFKWVIKILKFFFLLFSIF
jgi:hypothetical protein